MERHLTPEWMDAPDISPADHKAALAGLKRINRLSRVAPLLAQKCLAYAREKNLDQIHLLDIASGGGDVPLEVARRLQQAGVKVSLDLFDQSGTGLMDALRHAMEWGISVKLYTGDAMAALPDSAYDVVTCSLFLHHLTEAQVETLLGHVRRLSPGMVLISDLVRSRMGLLGAILGCHLLSRSAMVHHDGPASVRAAWTPGELDDIAKRAGLCSARIERCWPARMLFSWRS